MPVFTAESLLISIRNIASVGDTGAPGVTDTDLLLHANEALRNYLLPRVLNLREDYYILRERSALVAGRTRYRLPSRAAYNKLRSLWQVDGTGRLRLEPIPEEDLADHNGPGAGFPSGYILEGNDIGLIPDTGSYSGSLEFVYYQRPGSIVLSTEARQVLTVDLVTRVVTFSEDVPTTWTDTLKYDVHSEHSGAELKLWEQSATVLDDTMTFTGEIDGTVFGTKSVEVGDWIVLAGESALPALPIELHPALARQVALHLAEAGGNAQQVSIHAQILEKYFTENVKAMEQRVESKPIRLGGGGQGFLARGKW